MAQRNAPVLQDAARRPNAFRAPGKPDKGGLSEAQAQLMASWEAFGDVYLPYRLLLLAKLIDRRAAEHVAKVNLSLAEWRVIAHIRRFGTLTISGISRHAFVDRAEVCRAAASLERAGLLRREVNPGNRRSQLLELTEQGDGLFRIISEGRLAFFDDICNVLTPGERKAMESGLRKMALRVSES